MAHDHGGIEKQKKGISSFDRQDPKLVFSELNIKNGDHFLDIGCGAGDYTFYAQNFVGDSGFVYALEKWEELISKLNDKIESNKIKNMRAVPGDVTQKLPFADSSIDICLIAMVLHGFDITGPENLLFSELKRLLKPNGRIAVLEAKKGVVSPGPKEHERISAEEIQDSIARYGFRQIGYADLGSSYLVQFGINK